MKKVIALSAFFATLLVFSNCNSSKKVTTPAKVNYASGVETLVMANCSPCHIPSKGGNKLALDSYTSVKDNIDAIVTRIEMDPGTRGFMPFKRPKLSDSTIAVFKQWKTDGLLEK